MLALAPKKDGGPNAKFFESPEILTQLDGVKQWLLKSCKKVHPKTRRRNLYVSLADNSRTASGAFNGSIGSIAFLMILPLSQFFRANSTLDLIEPPERISSSGCISSVTCMCLRSVYMLAYDLYVDSIIFWSHCRVTTIRAFVTLRFVKCTCCK